MRRRARNGPLRVGAGKRAGSAIVTELALVKALGRNPRASLRKRSRAVARTCKDVHTAANGPNDRRRLLATKPASRAAGTLRVDLEVAGIPYETEDGVFDFHCLRVGYVTNLAKSGANLKVVQTAAPHSTIVMTMDLYARQDAKEAAAVLRKLPPIRRRRTTALSVKSPR